MRNRWLYPHMFVMFWSGEISFRSNRCCIKLQKHQATIQILNPSHGKNATWKGLWIIFGGWIIATKSQSSTKVDGLYNLDHVHKDQSILSLSGLISWSIKIWSKLHRNLWFAILVSMVYTLADGWNYNETPDISLAKLAPWAVVVGPGVPAGCR